MQPDLFSVPVRELHRPGQVTSGLPLLQDAARQDGPEAEEQLAQMVKASEAYYPKTNLIM